MDTIENGGNGKAHPELSHEARDVSALAQAFQKMAEQAERLAEGGESNAIRCIAAGEAMAYKMAAKRIREVIDPTVRRPIQVDTDALMVIYDSHIQMLEGLLFGQNGRGGGES